MMRFLERLLQTLALIGDAGFANVALWRDAASRLQIRDYGNETI